MSFIFLHKTSVNTDECQIANVLSCVSTKTCVYSGAVLGCCNAGRIATCTNLFTTCANYGDTCNSACRSNYNILKWYESPHGSQNLNIVLMKMCLSLLPSQLQHRHAILRNFRLQCRHSPLQLRLHLGVCSDGRIPRRLLPHCGRDTVPLIHLPTHHHHSIDSNRHFGSRRKPSQCQYQRDRDQQRRHSDQPADTDANTRLRQFLLLLGYRHRRHCRDRSRHYRYHPCHRRRLDRVVSDPA